MTDAQHPARNPAMPDGDQAHPDRLLRERDAALALLREREAELARVQTIGRIGGVEVNFDDGFRNQRSPEYLLIHGLPADAANESHDDWVDRLHPDDREATVRHFFDALNGAQTDYAAQYRIVRPSDGQTRLISVVAKIERAPDGRARRLVGAHIDVTEQMLAREKLRESEERFRLIADSAPVPIWVTKLDRTRAFANRAYLDFLGLPYDEAVVFDWRKALHPDDLDRILGEQVRGEGSLRPFILEARYRNASGHWRWLRSESQPRWDPTGQHIGFIGVAHDITDAKQAERELKQLNETLEGRIAERTAQLQTSQARLSAILETSNQHHVLTDRDGRIVFANRTALESVGANAKDVLGRLFWTTRWFASSQRERDDVRRHFHSALQGDAVRREARFRLADGERLFDHLIRPVFDSNGAISGILSEAVDITDRRASEDALRQSQKMEAVGQLTGGVAHDFNNLLTIIRSAVEFLQRPELSDERRRRYVAAISDTVDRASKLTGQLLAFARRQSLTPEVFDVNAQVRSVVQLIRPLVGGAIEIHFDVTDDRCFARADIAQFETALVNFAVNARDAMDGKGTLTIGVRCADQIPALRNTPARNAPVVAISVTDTGAGIPADKFEAIFEPFYTTKAVGKGTGLGLSQAFGFAQQSGGEIEVESEPGRGSTFTIYLPRADRITQPQSQRVRPATEQTEGRGIRVLVVEDDVDVGRLTTEMLHDLGYTIKWVSSGREALRTLESVGTAYDIVFSDVIMPEMSGLELAKEIRQRHPGLPVVLTSGFSEVIADQGHGEFELVRKPYSVNALSHAFRRSIAGAGPFRDEPPG